MTDDGMQSPQPNTNAAPESAAVITRELKSSRRRMWTATLLGAIVALATALLIAQNRESVQFNWLVFHFTTPLWVMLVLTAIAGSVFWALLRATWRRGRRVNAERRSALQAHRDASS